MKKHLIGILLLCNFSFLVHAESLLYTTGEFYCKLSHPIEWIVRNSYKSDNPQARRTATCEGQHVSQQQSGGSDMGNVSIVPRSSHDLTDNWGGMNVWGQNKVWEYSKNSDRWGTTEDAEDALSQAYKLGRHQLEYTFLLYNYNKSDYYTTLLNWDGMSHLTYIVSWWVNTPAKYLRKLSFLIDKGHYSLIIDHVIQFPVLLVEGVIGLFYNGAGVIIGTVLQPLDTLNAIIGGVWLILKSVLLGVLEIFLTLFLVLKSFF